MAVQRSVRLRRWSLALGTSIVAMGVASSAQAQCSPDPTLSFAPTTCTGTDNDGLTVDTFATRVVVADGAIVRSGTGDGAIVTRGRALTFDIRGQVDGGSKAGLLVTSQPLFVPDPIYAAVEVTAGGEIAGTRAIVVRSGAANNPTDIVATLTNAGRLTGTAGAAITVDVGNYNPFQRTLSLTNSGTITGVGTAIDSNGMIGLVNTGTIIGSVVSRASAVAGQGSSIDTLGGTIIGDLRLGASDDLLQARYDNGQVITGVTGAIDGGAGNDTLRMQVDADATIGSLAIPTGFEQVALAPAQGRSVTLVDGFSSPILISGNGTITNASSLTGTRQVVGREFGSSNSALVNVGTLRTTAAGAYAVTVDQRFRNEGRVDAAGDGVSFSSQATFVNTGTIVAAGTAVALFGPYFDNSGTIRSTNGTGVTLGGSSGSAWTNSGLIDGAAAGVQLNSTLVNTGTITSAGSGVVLDWYGVIDNRAGAQITGGIAAIAPNPRYRDLLSATVVNAGTINGDVTLSTRPIDIYPNDNRYFALVGGVLNGNLTLGGGDTLITELANDGPGAFAGINGTVTATESLLRYRVRSDVSVGANVPAGFAGVGYDLYGGAALTLTGAATPLTLAGDGRVDVAGDIAVSVQPALSVTSLAIAPGETRPDIGGLDITSRGALTLERSDNAQRYAAAAVWIGGEDTFRNVGTITVRDRATPVFSQLAAVSNGTVVNDGTITLDGAIGVRGATRVTNNGAIVQAAGGGAATGLHASGVAMRLVNTGTIDVAGSAIVAEYYGLFVDNSGRIASTGDVAIGMDQGGYATVTNKAGATIAGNGTAIRVSGGMLTNAGTITGSVDLGYSSFGRSFGSATYVADGGTIAGDLLFGSGDDTLRVYGDAIGVSGAIDGGDGVDTYFHARRTSGTVTLGGTLPTGFEREAVGAFGAGTVVTLAGVASDANALDVSGTGSIINNAAIGGMVMTGTDPFVDAPAGAPMLASFTNHAQLNGGFRGSVGRFVNAATGTITTQDPPSFVVDISQADAIDLVNDGSIDLGVGDGAISLSSGSAITAANSGTIVGGVSLSTQNRTDVIAAQPLTVSLVNTGTITGNGFSTPVELDVIDDAGGVSTLTLDNRGTIEATGVGGTAAQIEIDGGYFDRPVGGTRTGAIINSGTMRANAGGARRSYTDPFTGEEYSYTETAAALSIDAYDSSGVTVTNTVTGIIEATGALSTAVTVGGSLDLANAGTIRGGASYTADGFSYAGAIDAEAGDDRIVNTGTIIGSVALYDGDDRFENYGRIEGDVSLGAGDDTFLHRASATLIGTVDAGAGDDSLIIDATGGGTIRADNFLNFERFSQIGAGAVDYVGAFRSETIDVSGGTLTVAAGQTLSSAGATTITGSDAGETVDNAGTIDGSVALGAGNDTFVERSGSSVTGGVDGGTGADRYDVVLSGDRTGIGARTGFEQLAVTGSGRLSLTLDQDFESVALAGTALELTADGHAIGAVAGSDAADMLGTDRDIAQVVLGGGNDMLALGIARAAGRYVGGAGSDTLRFTAAGPIALAGTASGFEQVALAGDTLTVTGTLGAAGDSADFGAGDQRLVLGDGGTLAGTIDLGAGNDGFRLLPGGTIAGRVLGGAGDDMATIVLSGARTLDGAVLSGFETLASEGNGTLTLTGAHGYDRVATSGDLTIAGGATLAARSLALSGADDRLTIAGGFTGAVDGGSGSDTVAVSGGSAAAPVAFSSIANVEAFGMSGGFATLSGAASVGAIELTGGRFVGLAGSSLSAAGIAVAQGATFGSAGTVNGNLTVAGTLSPGASPGTMTVNGNVALASGSRALFELTPTLSDKLVINGALSIATGTTLDILSDGALRPGTSYDLITASGGISGSFTTVNKPGSLFGFVVQRADRIQLLGQFLNDARFAPQVARSVAYANATLAVQPASSTLFAALPALVDDTGASNPRAFAQLTPEPYASATQLGVDHALTLSQAARGTAFGTDREDAGLFTFAQTVGQWHALQGDASQGSAAARAQSYGFLSGLGFGDRGWSVGAFAGYLNGRQQVGALGARTRADGVVAGVHGRYTADGGWGFSASVLYDGSDARTDRALPGTRGASARYGLHSWVSDLSAHYALDVAEGWTMQPRAGVTYVRTTRDGVAEDGGSAFALQVARDRHVAGFADAGVSLMRSDASDAPFRPFVSLGARYQIEGRRVDALAGYAGGGLGLSAVGASRSELVGTAAGGVAYRLPSGLDLFASASAQTGRDDHQETISAGVRLRF